MLGAAVHSVKRGAEEWRGEPAGVEAVPRSGVPVRAVLDAGAVLDGVGEWHTELVRSHGLCESARSATGRSGAADHHGAGAVARSWSVAVVGMLVHHDHRHVSGGAAASSLATRGGAA